MTNRDKLHTLRGLYYGVSIGVFITAVSFIILLFAIQTKYDREVDELIDKKIELRKTISQLENYDNQ